MNTIKKHLKWLVPLIIILVASVASVISEPGQPSATQIAQSTGPDIDLGQFERADSPMRIEFPKDNGPHPDYLTEWWYYTGNLDTQDGRHFGFQLTFFRRALVPAALQPNERGSDWATDQLYMAHFSLTDVENDQFYAFERFSRGAADLAGAIADPYEVWLDNWQVIQTGDSEYSLSASTVELSIQLNLKDLKGPILHGIDGYSQKGPEPGDASIYISQTRLEANGTIAIGEDENQVAGYAWMDHEYSTSALGPDQIGWDWFSIQLDDETEIMVFQLRQEDGGIAESSSGTIIFKDGSVKSISKDDFILTVLDTWQSPTSQGEYPSRWRLEIPSEDISLSIIPYTANQELNVTFSYWEGAVQITGNHGQQEVNGAGYIEMTGYAHSMQGEF